MHDSAKVCFKARRSSWGLCLLIVTINQELLAFVRVCGKENEKKFVCANVVMKPSPVGYCLIKPIKYVSC